MLVTRQNAHQTKGSGRLDAEKVAIVHSPAALARPSGNEQITNALTVDVEDYFQVSAFADKINRDDWDNYPCRVEENVESILQLFDEQGVHATFFTLGWIGERYPQLLAKIVAAGHELASHGQNHIRVGEQSPEEFRLDIRGAKHLLEDLAGVAIRGYRAASFSIGKETLWAHEILADEGYAYSSSIYPIYHDLYGMPEAPRHAFRVGADSDLLEIPISTVRFGGRNFPCGGGGYFRLMPYPLARWALRRVNQSSRQPSVFYFHPWEIDPDQPRIPGVSLKTRTRHYLNLQRMERRLQRLLSDFSWDRMDSIFLSPGELA
jgi:polysaccharide deacetylase family protein (PEP-CTERM system associated)